MLNKVLYNTESKLIKVDKSIDNLYEYDDNISNKAVKPTKCKRKKRSKKVKKKAMKKP